MTPNGTTPTDHAFTRAADDIGALQNALGGAIVGQQRLIEQLLCAVLAGGHVLLEGLPGLGKTHLVKGLGRVLGVSTGRIQCTPDLMPADVTGSEVLTRNDGHEALRFAPGPVFANLVLVDEINRATPKTQAALLEAMQESQVTQGGRSHPLPLPFWVVATQNPIEIEGTYPLPEAQLDRFAVKLHLEFPDADGLLALLDVALDAEPADTLEPLLDAARLQALLELARAALIAAPVRRAAVDLVLATHGERGPAAALRYGASPRALQALLRCARVRALAQGRAHVAYADLDAMARPCLRHRIVLGMDAALDGKTPEQVLDEIVARWKRERDV
jgi:MoxR-like ATPase